MKVRYIMHSPVMSIPATTTLRDAASFFRREQVRGAQVIDEQGRAEGVFSYEELLNALTQGADLSESITRYMRTMLCSVHPDTEVAELKRYGSAFLTVVDNGQVVGSIDAGSVDDALKTRALASRNPSYHVLENMPDPVFVVNDGWEVRWFNKAASLFGNCEMGDMGGQPLADVLTASGFEVDVDPLDKRTVLLVWREESRFLPIAWSAEFSSGISVRVVLLRNVRENVMRSRELAKFRSLSKELESIIESSFDGIYITDGKGRTLRVNRAYERITGIRAGEVLGRTMTDLVDEGYYDASAALKVLETRQSETIIQKVKDTKTIVVTGNPIFDEEGGIWRVVTNVRDVTELQRLQSELERMARLEEEYRREIGSLRRSIGERSKVIIRSKKMHEIQEQAMRLAHVDSSVLITGESGVGKEVVAELIHSSSPRHAAPFVKISCASIPEQLLESELFGYKAGAFTGALRTGKRGVFETAHGGTLFLDEIGEMPLGLQAKLLRVLQEKTIMQIGGVQDIPIDVRIIAATNRNLEEMVREKAFRHDLYYRLNVVPLFIPPLRERREAIIDLTYHFIGRCNQRYGLNKQIDPDAMDLLRVAKWSGNVRELSNTVERLVVMGTGNVITYDMVRTVLKPAEDMGGCLGPEIQGLGTLDEIVQSAEKMALAQAIQTFGTSRAVAKALGVNQSTIVRKIQKYGLKIT